MFVFNQIPDGIVSADIIMDRVSIFEFYDLSALYRLFKSLYSHMYRAYRGKK